MRRPVDWRGLLRRLFDEPRFGSAAQVFAQAHAGFTQQGLVEQLADVFERNLPGGSQP